MNGKSKDEISKGALSATAERLLHMHCEYKHYMNNDPREISSAGMVPGYKPSVSGRTNRTSDFTAMNAIRLANIPKRKIESLKWIDCAWRVFMRGTASSLMSENMPINTRRKRAAISFVLYYKAFLGYTFKHISQMEMPHRGEVSRQRVHEIWKEAVREVAREAIREGLLPQK
jgi:hypothetical protein